MTSLSRLPSGGLPAASIHGLTTGFEWTYPHAAHVGATAWAVFAELGANPFWLRLGVWATARSRPSSRASDLHVGDGRRM